MQFLTPVSVFTFLVYLNFVLISPEPHFGQLVAKPRLTTGICSEEKSYIYVVLKFEIVTFQRALKNRSRRFKECSTVKLVKVKNIYFSS